MAYSVLMSFYDVVPLVHDRFYKIIEYDTETEISNIFFGNNNFGCSLCYGCIGILDGGVTRIVW